MIEVMFGMGILAFMALALLPAMLSLGQGLKVNSFEAQCSAIVRAKMQEYVNGVAASGQLGNTPTATTTTRSGFEYTKARYYDNADTYCEVNPDLGTPGFRERISTNKIVSATAGADDDPLTPDVPDKMQGFQLWVNIRHYNPRVSAGAYPRRQCPTGGSFQTPRDYQFQRVGDALEVTITGMIRVRPAVTQGGRGGKKWGNIDDLDNNTPNRRLTCSSSQLIYPPRVPFRYYLGADGKIRNYQAGITFVGGVPQTSKEALEIHFRSLWSQDPGNTGTINSGVLSNIRSFAISPNNNSAYILLPGELRKYTACSDATRTMTKTAADGGGPISIEGIPDCVPATFTSTTVPGNIENIAVDFQDVASGSDTDDVVYGLFNSGGNSAGEVSRIDIAAGAGTPTASAFVIPSDKPRIRGIFLAPTFPPVTTTTLNLFYFDNTCASATQEGFCVSLFNSADSSMARPVREMPVQAEAISF